MGIRMQRRWLLLAALVLITLGVCLNSRRTDCRETDKELLGAVQNNHSVPVTSHGDCPVTLKLKQEETALKLQIRQLQAQLSAYPAPAGGKPEVLGTSKPRRCELWCADHEAAWSEKCCRLCSRSKGISWSRIRDNHNTSSKRYSGIVD